MNSKNSGRLFGILAALVFLVGAGAIYMKWDAINTQESEVDKVQIEVESASGVEKDLAESEKRIADLKVKLSHLERGVPDYAYLPTMLRELERYGKACGVDVTGVRPIAAPPIAGKPGDPMAGTQKSYDELTVEVRGRASYADALRFVKALQNFPKIVAARTISLAPKQANALTSESPLLELVIELKVFVFPQDNPTSSPTTPGQQLPSGGTTGGSNGASVRLEVPNANG